jgi:predicted secreted protein
MLSLLRFAGMTGIVILLSTATATADEVVATAADNGKTVSVHVGQTLRINLTGTHGSGKYWRLNGDLTPELTLSGRTTDAVAVAGAAETTSISFKSNSPGSLAFKATYLLAGAEIPKIDDLAFTINVLP